MAACTFELTAVVLLSMALLLSFCLNVIFFIRRRASLHTDECCGPCLYERESMSQDEGLYLRNLNHQKQREDSLSHCEQLENPIYGNIGTDRRGSSEMCYEMMTMQHTRDRMTPSAPNLNYASLELKVANKHKKKHRHQHGHAQGCSAPQDQLPLHLTTPANAFVEVGPDLDSELASRDTSTMVSHSSIYLNSQQIAQETEGMGRERSANVEGENAGWQELGRLEDDRKDRQDYSNGGACAQISDAEFFDFFSVQQD